MAARDSFLSPADYYHVLFHELGHSTGHATRLDREGITECASYGSPVYSREELVAELTAANLSAHAGIDSPSLGENQAAYVAGWVARLKDDAKAVIWAAGKASRAADFILGKHRAEDADTANEGGQA
jgi:antirestriction protein ArdC